MVEPAVSPVLPAALLGELYPFQSHFHAVPGGCLHYVDEGEGEPVVMLHGNPTWSFYYRNLIKALRGDFRTIALDHMGCGFSDKPQRYPYTLGTHIDNLEALLDHLGLERVTLVVHDWGGAIGMGWAVRHPERVSRLVVFNTAAFLGGPMPLRLRVSRWPVLGEIGILHMNGFVRGLLRMATARPGRLSPEVRRGYLMPYDSPAHRVAHLAFVRDIPVDARVPSHAVLAEVEEGLSRLVDHEMLIAWGMQDWCFGPWFLSEWSRRFPAARVERYSDAGHLVVEDAVESVVPAVRGFLGAGAV